MDKETPSVSLKKSPFHDFALFLTVASIEHKLRQKIQTEVRNSYLEKSQRQLGDEIRKDYEKKLSLMKEKYERQIQKQKDNHEYVFKFKSKEAQDKDLRYKKQVERIQTLYDELKQQQMRQKQKHAQQINKLETELRSKQLQQRGFTLQLKQQKAEVNALKEKIKQSENSCCVILVLSILLGFIGVYWLIGFLAI